MKQKPTLTPKEQLAASRVFDEGAGYVSAVAMGMRAKKLGRAAMPPEEGNDADAGDGARRKIPLRYD